MVCRVLLAVAVVCTTACAPGGAEPPEGSATPTYDQTTGKLKELAYTARDGRVDRWEYYDDRQRLVKVGFSRSADGVADAWAFSAPDGTVQRIEISSSQ